MASFVEYGQPMKTYYSTSNPQTSSYYGWLATGFRGSIKRPRPKDLIRAMTGHSASRTQREAGYLTYVPPSPLYPGQSYVTQGPPQVAVGDNVGNGLVSYDAKVSLWNQNDAKVRLRLKNQKWNAATTVAELGQTMSFLATTTRELFDYYRLARKGDFLRLSELYRQRDQRGKRYPPWPVRVSNRYLAYRYAVRPLVADIDGVINTFIRGQVRPVIQSVSAHGSTYASKFAQEPDWQGNPAYPIHYVGEESYTSFRKLYYEVQPDVQRWKSLGFVNLASVLWEVTPYSFMVDKVLPIGQFINSLDATFGVGLVADLRSDKTMGTATRSVRNGFVRARNESYSRTVNLGFPSVTAVFAPSPSGIDLVDSLALLVQLRNRQPVKGF